MNTPPVRYRIKKIIGTRWWTIIDDDTRQNVLDANGKIWCSSFSEAVLQAGAANETYFRDQFKRWEDKALTELVGQTEKNLRAAAGDWEKSCAGALSRAASWTIGVRVGKP